MRRNIVVGVLMGILLLGWTASSEASIVSKAVGRVYNYAISPINCVANLTADLTNAVVKFGLCFFHNINPEQLIP